MKNSSQLQPLMSSFSGEKQLPFFPLSLFLLPNGLYRLRIFEPKYFALVSDACQRGGFVVLLEQQHPHPHQQQSSLTDTNSSTVLGCWLEIVDFNGDSSNILFIDVKCRALVNIVTVVNTGNAYDDVSVSYKDFWQIPDQVTVEKELAQSLLQLFKQQPTLNELYHGQVYEEPAWLVSRWLELLPIDIEQKNHLISPESFPVVRKLVYQLLFES